LHQNLPEVIIEKGSNDHGPDGGDMTKNKMTRRNFLIAGAVTTAGLVVAGCKTNEVEAPTAASPTLQTKATQPASPTVGVATSARPTLTAEVTQPVSPTAGAASTLEILGTAKGIFPGRVVWVHNPAVTRWDGKTGLWWDDSNIDLGAVTEMLSQAIRQQTGKSDDKTAWDALFQSFNNDRGKAGVGYTPGEKIAIKLNLNVISAKHNYRDNGTFTSPQLVFAMVEQLVKNAGVPANAITLYDSIRYIPDGIVERFTAAEYQGLQFVDWVGGNGRVKSERDANVMVQWSKDMAGSPTYLPTAVTQATYLVNMASLKPHNLAGVTLCAKNHFGTIMADWKGAASINAPQGANIHGTVAAHAYDWGAEWNWPQAPMGSYNALVDLIGHPHLGGKTLLFTLDGLYVAHDQNANVTDDCRWESAPFNNHWTSSLLVSQDNIAIDSVGLDLILAEPSTGSLPECLPKGSTPDNYLHEGSQADKAPSGTIYKPDGKTSLSSLGVHEHWNNAIDKQYSRNLKVGNGIELIKVG
jgi:hypothetical protein